MTMKSSTIACAIFLLALIVRASEAAEWNYTHQHLWEGFCSGMSQSPINIDTHHVEEWHKMGVRWKNNATKFGMVTVKNSGHGFSVSGPNMKKLHLHGGGLDGDYVLAQFHYHWGWKGNGYKGSEHRIDGEQWSSEIHLVHHREEFKDLTEALNSGKSNALAVVGVMLKQAGKPPMGHEKILMHAVKNISQVNNMKPESVMVDLMDTKIMHLLPMDCTKFYRYMGSLTTPTCNEQVVWTVLEMEAMIAMDFLEVMPNVEDKFGEDLHYTARDEQKLNGRKVYHNLGPHSEHDSGSSVTPFVFNIAALLAVALALLR